MNERSPYAPPAADVAVQEEIRNGSPVKAVLLGVVTDIGGTMVFGVVVGLLYGGAVALTGGQEMAREALLATMESVGFFFSFLGGYVCARIVRERELHWGAVTGASSALIGMAMSGGSAFAGNFLLLSIGAFGATVFGAWWARRKNLRQLQSMPQREP